MKMPVLFLLFFTCPIPVVLFIVQTIPHRYELIMSYQSWAAAQDYCRGMYTDLAIILSPTDWLRFNKETTSKSLTSGTMWVGLWNDINSWRWSLGELPLKSCTYFNWWSGDPNNGGGHEACVIIGGPNLWLDAPCTQLRPFICYDAKFIGSAKFILINNPWLSWLDARAYCRQYHTDLASSLNSTDNNMIAQLVGPTYPWIGLYRDTWKWSDGTNATNLPWAPAQPDNTGGNENCAVIYNDQLNDVTCTNLYYFFCHTDFPTRSQIMRLQVKFDGSVFNPAVQSLILDQIKQKLEENGMLKNTTVTWSVQPAGNIFYKKKKN